MLVRMLLPMCLVGLVVGFLIMVSPFYITGGIICWLDHVPPDAWLNHLLGTVISVFLGLLLIAGSGTLAVAFGLIFAADATSNTQDRRLANEPSGGSNKLPTVTQLTRKSDDNSMTVATNVDPMTTDEASTIDESFCYHCGEVVGQTITICPYCSGSLAE